MPRGRSLVLELGVGLVRNRHRYGKRNGEDGKERKEDDAPADKWRRTIQLLDSDFGLQNLVFDAKEVVVVRQRL